MTPIIFLNSAGLQYLTVLGFLNTSDMSSGNFPVNIIISSLSILNSAGHYCDIQFLRLLKYNTSYEGIDYGINIC